MLKKVLLAFVFLLYLFPTPSFGKIKIWVSKTEVRGNLGGRAGADRICANDDSRYDFPVGSESHVRALISIDENDQAKDMAENYDIPVDEYDIEDWGFATMVEHFDDLFTPNRSIFSTPSSSPDKVWTFSNADGSLDSNNNCSNGTSRSSRARGITGIANVGNQLIRRSRNAAERCNVQAKLLCLMYNDSNPPFVATVERLNPDAPLNTPFIEFRITFTEEVVGVGVETFDLDITGDVEAEVTDVTGSGSRYDVTVHVENGEGELRFVVTQNGRANVKDLKGNQIYVDPELMEALGAHRVSFTTTSQTNAFNTEEGTGLQPFMRFLDGAEKLIVADSSHLVDAILNGGDGVDTIELPAKQHSDLSVVQSLTSFEKLALNQGSTAELTQTLFDFYKSTLSSPATGNETLIIKEPEDGVIQALDQVNNYQLQGDFQFTLSRAEQSVLGSQEHDQSVDLGGFSLSGTIDGGAGQFDILSIANGADFTGATVTNFEQLIIADGTNARMTLSQLNGFTEITGANSGENITLSGTGTLTVEGISLIEFLSTSVDSIDQVITLSAEQANNKILTAAEPQRDSFTVTPSDGDQVINGSDGSDNLSGGAGSDRLRPRKGADTLTGGPDDDIFIGTEEELNGDTITDISNEDQVVIEGTSGLQLESVQITSDARLLIDTNNASFTAASITLHIPNKSEFLSVDSVTFDGANTVIQFSDEYPPEFSNVNNTVVFTENQAPIVIDSDIAISDRNLDKLNNGAGDYTGTSLTITGRGSEHDNFDFAAHSGISSMLEGQDILMDGESFGRVVENSNGALKLSFAKGTTAQINRMLTSITYSNSSNTPVNEVVFDWSFSDGALVTLGTNQTRINIVAVNDPPTEISVSTLSLNDSDTGQNKLFATLSAVDLDGVADKFSLVTAGSAGSGACEVGQDADNDAFAISGEQLRTKSKMAGGRYDICVQVEDDGQPTPASYEQHFVLVISDNSVPVISEKIPVPSLGNNPKPNVTITSSEAVTLTFIGRCGTSEASHQLIQGENTIQLTAADNLSGLPDGSYQNCMILATDSAGNQSETLSLSEFEIDTRSPFLSPLSLPSDNANSVLKNAEIKLVFDEAIKLLAGQSIDVIEVSSSSTFEHFTIGQDNSASGSLGGRISIEDKTLTLVAGSEFKAGSHYALQIGADAVADIAGNSLPAITDNSSYNFTTVPNLILTLTPDIIVEDGGVANLTVSLADQAGTDFTTLVDFAVNFTLSGDATREDFQLTGPTWSGTRLTIPSGASSASVTITGTADTVVGEALETLVATIVNNTINAPVISESSVSLKITENFIPTLTGVASTLDIVEDEAKYLETASIEVNDRNHARLSVRFNVDKGILASPNGQTANLQVSGEGTNNLVLSGPISDLTAFFASNNAVSVTTEKDNTDNIQLTVTANDGVDDSDSSTMAIRVRAVNDAPTEVVLSNTVITQANTGELTTVATLSAIDPDDTPSDFVLVTSGSATTGLCETGHDRDNHLFVIDGINLQSQSALEPQDYKLCIQVSDDETPVAASFEQALVFRVADESAPSVTEVSSVLSPSNNTSPRVRFNSSEEGVLILEGSCGTTSETAVSIGQNTIVLAMADNQTPLEDGTYSDCTITVEDESGNTSVPVAIDEFIIDTVAPELLLDSGNTNPHHQTSRAGLDSVITLDFSEEVVFREKQVLFVADKDNRIIETFTFEDSTTGSGGEGGTVIVVDGDIELSLAKPLQKGQRYSVQFSSDTILDSAGNAHQPFNSSSWFYFATTPEVMMSRTPEVILEDGGEAEFRIELINSEQAPFVAIEDVTFDLGFTGSASKDSDYSVSNLEGSTIRIPIGSSSASFKLVGVNDAPTVDDEEDAVITITDNNINAAAPAPLSVTLKENFIPTITGLPESHRVTEDQPSNFDLSGVVVSDQNDRVLSLHLILDSGTIDPVVGNTDAVSVTQVSAGNAVFEGEISALHAYFDNRNAVSIINEKDSTLDMRLSAHVNDGKADSEVMTAVISVTAVNDAPELISRFDAEFDMTGTLDSDTNFSELENGVAMTVSLDNGVWQNQASAVNVQGQGESIFTQDAETELTTFTFDKPIDIQQFVHFTLHADTSNYTYTPTGAQGSEVSHAIASGSQIITPESWKGITSFTVTNVAGAFAPGFDSLKFTGPLPLPERINLIEDLEQELDLSAFDFVDVDSESIHLTLLASSGTFITSTSEQSSGEDNEESDPQNARSLSAQQADQNTAVVISQTEPNAVILQGSADEITQYLNGQTVKYQPQENLNGEAAAHITIKVDDTDGSGVLTLYQLALDIENTDDAPELVNNIDDSATAAESGTPYEFKPEVNDLGDGDTLVFTIENKPPWATFDPVTGTLSGTPTNADAGTFYNIVISVSDGTTTVSLPPFDLEVTPIDLGNFPPEIHQGSGITVTMSEDGEPIPFALSLSAGDINGDELEWYISTPPQYGTVEVEEEQGWVDYQPNPEFHGQDVFFVQVSDGQAHDEIRVTVNVIAVDDTPIISGQPELIALAGQPYKFEPQGFDGDGDSLTFSIKNTPMWAEFDATTGSLSGTPVELDIGLYQGITISVSDGKKSAQLPSFDISVVKNERKPELAEQSIETQEDKEVSLRLPEVDQTGLELTYHVLSEAQKGEVSITGNQLTYTPKPNENGDDSLVLQADNGEFTSDPARVSVLITEVNDAPNAENDEIHLPLDESNTYLLDVLANDMDVDGDPLRIVKVESGIGNVLVKGKQIQYQAIEGFSGELELAYIISDDKGETDRAQVNLIIGEGQLSDSGIKLIVPADMEVDATGVFTRVDIGVATATDVDGNPVPVRLSTPLTPLPVGKNLIYWQAGEGTEMVTAAQVVNVSPMISLGGDQKVRFGQTVRVPIILNGYAPSYPVIVKYEVSGEASSQTNNVTSGQISIIAGMQHYLEFDAPDGSLFDDEAELIIRLAEGQNNGVNDTSVITLTNQNLAPRVLLTVQQNGESRNVLAQDQGLADVLAQVADDDSADEITLDWQSSELVNTGADASRFEFEPASVEVGIHKVELAVTDPANTTQASTFVKIIESFASLSHDKDTDGDGIPDAIEGYKDSDGDGIPDYLDAIGQCNLAPESAAVQTSFLIEAEPGVCIKLGSLAMNSLSGGLDVNPQGTGFELPEDTEVVQVGRILDFTLYQLSLMGGSYKITLPQRAPLPVNALYRKYNTERGWFTFVENEHNKLFSAPGEKGFCPPPGAKQWQPGLTAGHWCVQLELQDGGANDADGAANYALSDPGVIAVIPNEYAEIQAVDDIVQTRVDKAISIPALANDIAAEGNALSLTSVVADFGKVTINLDDTIDYTPPLGYLGKDTVFYGINGKLGGSSWAKVMVNIGPNHAPVLVDDRASAVAGVSLLIDVLANDSDPDGDDLRLVQAKANYGLVVVNDDNTLSYTSSRKGEAQDQIEYVATDGDIEVSAFVTVTITQGSTSSGQGNGDESNKKHKVTVNNQGGGSVPAGLLFGLLLLICIRAFLVQKQHQ